MNELINKMKLKILELSNPNSNYTVEDFGKEFGDSHYLVNETDAFKIKLKFVNKSNNPTPEYATIGSSGFDLRADLREPMVLKSGQRALVPTGLFFEIPLGFEIQVRPRSGLAIKNGITVLNTPGTVDSDYRGEVKVILVNLGNEDFIINNGDRIAQAVLTSVTNSQIVSLTEVKEISDKTGRDSGGFGSTGIK